jgi:hypothetical protein
MSSACAEVKSLPRIAGGRAGPAISIESVRVRVPARRHAPTAGPVTP